MERVPYDELRVWLEMNLRDHYNDIVSLWDNIEFGEFTPGSVIFADTDGSLTEDNPNFFYDDTNNRLGIGTNTPATFLHVLGTTTQLRLGFDATKYVNFTVDTSHDLTIKPTSTGQVIFQPTTDSTDFFQILDADGGTPIFDVDSVNERVGIGLATPRDTLEVYQRFITDPILFNTLVGANAGNGITTGSSNVIMGYQAANGLVSGIGNIVFGYKAGFQMIDSGSWVTSYNVLLGYEAGYNIVPTASGTVNIFIGYHAGYGAAQNTGYENIGIGDQALDALTTGYYNIAIGAGALGACTSGNANIAIGQSMSSLTTGVTNVGVGLCFNSLTTGLNNCSYGWNTFEYITTGQDNCAYGYQAGRFFHTSSSRNTIIGDYAARGTLSQIVENSTYLGCYAGNAGYGSYNNILGAFAGYSLTTGASNIFLGYEAGYRQTTGSNLFIVDNQQRTYADRSEPYLCLMYGNIDADATARDLNINSDVLIRNASTLGSESLNETDFATHVKWAVTGDFDDTGGNAHYHHNTGSGTLTQTAANMAVAGVPNRYYKFTYFVSDITYPLSGTITTSFASSAVTLDLTTGTHTIYFQANSSPGNFVISISSSLADSTLTLDNFTLKELQGGNMTVNKIMRSKRLLAGGIAA